MSLVKRQPGGRPFCFALCCCFKKEGTEETNLQVNQPKRHGGKKKISLKELIFDIPSIFIKSVFIFYKDWKIGRKAIKC